ncbi:MAG: hypothetical protein PVG65_01225 [Candidatus Thorarchaeota archaeon]|jgi:hypothetical protein
MKKKLKEYEYKKSALLSWLLIAFLFFIFAFILGFLENEIVFKIPGMCSLVIGILFIVIFIRLMNTPFLVTTEEEIILRERPYAKPLHIPVKDIVKVKQQDKTFWPGVLIWYTYEDEIRKTRIFMKNLRKEDQKEFLDYLEKIY